tara:strand:+ start:285 stop:410 length:126 start_codon:yes stop_codon:yes gene_type:complete
MKILEEEKTFDCSVDALWSFLSFGQNAVGLDFLRVAKKTNW